MIRRLLPLLLVACAVADDHDHEHTDTHTFDVTVDGEQGRYAVRVWADTTPAQGAATFTVEPTSLTDDAPVVGADVTVTPWMPAHGHGADAAVVTETSDGVYEATLTFPMAGAWELQVGIDGPEGTDAAVVPVEVD